MCIYQYESGTYCSDPPEPGSNYCILHMDLPSDTKSQHWQYLSISKNIELNKKISSGVTNFEGGKYGDLIFDTDVKDSINFNNSSFLGIVSFKNLKFEKGLGFINVTFFSFVYFENVSFQYPIIFFKTNFKNCFFLQKCKFYGLVFFHKIEFVDLLKISDSTYYDLFMLSQIKFYKDISVERSLFFNGLSFLEVDFLGEIKLLNNSIHKEFLIKYSKINFPLIIVPRFCRENIILVIDFVTIKGNLEIKGIKLNDDSIFEMIGTKIEGNLILNNLKIGGILNFNNLDVIGNISLNDTTITNPDADENLYRKMKNHATELGDKKMSDIYFYREKVAGRKIIWKEYCEIWKKINRRSSIKEVFRNSYLSYKLMWRCFFELILDKYFFYGTKPTKTFIYWIMAIIVFAIIFFIFSMTDAGSFIECFYFSITNAMTPGYGDFNPTGSVPTIFACIEAIFGAFTWGCFIAIIARKYMGN